MLWIIIVLLLLILIDVIRLHRKIDRMNALLNPEIPPTNEEIEKMLASENNKL